MKLKTIFKTFGSSLSTDAQYEYWLGASSYLSYGGILRVIRTDGDNLNNSNAGVSVASTTLKISTYEDYINNQQTATSWYYAAKNPGKWANNLKVCTIDAFADQIIVGVATTGVSVGMGITQSINGRVIAGAGSTSSATGYLRGIITGVGASELYVKVSETVSGTTVSQIAYTEGGTYAFQTPTTSTVSTTVGVATTSGFLSEAFDASITGIATGGILLGDIVSGTSVAAGTTVVSIGASTIFVDKTITAGIGTTTFTFTRGSTSSTVSNAIQVITVAGVTTRLNYFCYIVRLV